MVNNPLYVDSNSESVEKSEVTFFEKAIRLDYETVTVDLWDISKLPLRKWISFTGILNEFHN
ncbi:predicted protein [Pyrenophora tritici-repentis Pt-1C-BFP]|uniref:Uncharacterized protein n=1 Tax=Pyrenophora tritici-repentis (strain Pt-1C-BFP) TaxID=426418 RepID=B2VQT6_PYRTR|nr:uncharacterized protein PTRG_00430 [Pyrenophora tritici-repentis Pt-1C-BFP]EDU39868.1 predicted protein [Pyrenophora tritici-repentis Pt-1C-BFP]